MRGNKGKRERRINLRCKIYIRGAVAWGLRGEHVAIGGKARPTAVDKALKIGLYRVVP